MIEPLPEKLTTEQKKHNRKQVLIMLGVLVGLITFALIFAGGLIYYVYSTGGDTEVENTTPTQTLTITPSVTPTVVATPQSSEEELNKFVLSDCEVRLEISDLWISAPKGSLGTCGLFYIGDQNGIANFEDYDGVVVAFLPIFADSPFALSEDTNLSEYLDDLPTKEDRFDVTNDFLYSLEDSLLGGLQVQKANIYKTGVGNTIQIFYEINGEEFILIYGGNQSGEKNDDIEKLISSVEYLTVLPTIIN